MFFYIFTYFFIFFFRRLAAIKHFLLYRTDVFLLTSKKFFQKIIINAWSSATIWRTFVISLQKNT
jgi:hypothetical protein